MFRSCSDKEGRHPVLLIKIFVSILNPHIFMKHKILRLIDKLFGQELRAYYEVPSMKASFRNLQRLGFDPRFMVDIGAFQGEWTTMALTEFPAASVLMLEAQENKRPTLEAIKAGGHGKIDFRMAVMGPNDGDKVMFHEYENSPTASSMLQDNASTPTRQVEKQMRTLDSILSTDGFPKPDLIKLDVQGYELEVLKGAKQALLNAEAVLMEVSIIELYQNSPVLNEVTAFMSDQGFRTYDICSLLRRPLDKALCQVDIIFVKEDSKFLGRKIWG